MGNSFKLSYPTALLVLCILDDTFMMVTIESSFQLGQSKSFKGHSWFHYHYCMMFVVCFKSMSCWKIYSLFSLRSKALWRRISWIPLQLTAILLDLIRPDNLVSSALTMCEAYVLWSIMIGEKTLTQGTVHCKSSRSFKRTHRLRSIDQVEWSIYNKTIRHALQKSDLNGKV